MTAKRTQAGRELDSVVEAFAEVKACVPPSHQSSFSEMR